MKATESRRLHNSGRIPSIENKVLFYRQKEAVRKQCQTLAEAARDMARSFEGFEPKEDFEKRKLIVGATKEDRNN